MIFGIHREIANCQHLSCRNILSPVFINGLMRQINKNKIQIQNISSELFMGISFLFHQLSPWFSLISSLHPSLQMNNFIWLTSAKPKVFHKDAATRSYKTTIIIIITIIINFLLSAHNMCEVEPKLRPVNP